MFTAQPEYACVILHSARGDLILERRGPGARHAANHLTCFGGRRERGETALACARRELMEELAWSPARLVSTADLRQGRRWIARFFTATDPTEPACLRPSPGISVICLRMPDLATAPISPWHRAVLDAVAAGRRVARLA